jgi:NAD(P)-dependent dehydrogenase (short-subunit alcohol dehydrogenase family)
MDFARRGVRVNGDADSPIVELVVLNTQLAPQYVKTISLGRFWNPEDIGNAVLFLACDEEST